QRDGGSDDIEYNDQPIPWGSRQRRRADDSSRRYRRGSAALCRSADFLLSAADSAATRPSLSLFAAATDSSGCLSQRVLLPVLSAADSAATRPSLSAASAAADGAGRSQSAEP